MINYTYGILCGGRTPLDSQPGFRFSNAVPSQQQLAIVSKLLPYEGVDLPLAVDFYLKLLKCSSYWTVYEPKYDPDNTYSTELIIPISSALIPTLYEDMVRWDSLNTIKSDEFPYTKYDPLTFRVCGKLFATLAL